MLQIPVLHQSLKPLVEKGSINVDGEMYESSEASLLLILMKGL